jgi:hypothetical protein
MATRASIIHIILVFSAIVLISIIYGILGFVYSFFGLIQQSNTIIILEPFRLITLEELGGHFLFGAIVGIPTRSIKMILLAGLMAVTIDSDHLLNFAGFHVQGRPDHSIGFAVLSSILMGLLASRIYYKASGRNTIITTTLPFGRFRRCKGSISEGHKDSIGAMSTKAIDRSRGDNNYDLVNKNKQFLSLVIITLAAFMSHIAYDTLVDDKALFPLFIPFSFDQIIIPRMYSLPIEAAAFLLVYLHYIFSHSHSIFTSHNMKTAATRAGTRIPGTAKKDIGTNDE